MRVLPPSAPRADVRTVNLLHGDFDTLNGLAFPGTRARRPPYARCGRCWRLGTTPIAPASFSSPLVPLGHRPVRVDVANRAWVPHFAARLRVVTTCAPFVDVFSRAGGFASMRPPFTIQRVPPSDKLPSASTCFNLLKLPDYGDSSTTLAAKLRLSVVEGTTGFAFS